MSEVEALLLLVMLQLLAYYSCPLLHRHCTVSDIWLCLLHNVNEVLYVVGETVAEGDSLSGHWWIMLLAALVVMLAVAVIIFIICFVTHARRQKPRRHPAGNTLVLLQCSHLCKPTCGHVLDGAMSQQLLIVWCIMHSSQSLQTSW